MIKILTVIGARPQFVKAAAISHEFSKTHSGNLKEVLVHTGQHYDTNMSEVFFTDLSIPDVSYNLNVGSSSHGVQTSKIIAGLEEVLLKERPDGVVLYGDTNSTLGGAIAASKLEIPVVHIEAGLRSFTKNVPEEINRVVCDHLSTLLFTPTEQGVRNLINEGISFESDPPYSIDNPKVYLSGDVMYDISLRYRTIAEVNSKIIDKLKINPDEFVLATIHRQNNTDDPNKLLGILKALNDLSIAFQMTMVLPLHPRTKGVLSVACKDAGGHEMSFPGILFISPVSYIDMVCLEANARMIVTDSGGVQKEAYFFSKPCLILQDETPWVELLDNGSSILAGSDPERIKNGYQALIKESIVFDYPPLYGDGRSAEFITENIVQFFK
jgi:UDP-GlcNAc3NAcA epimerase